MDNVVQFVGRHSFTSLEREDFIRWFTASPRFTQWSLDQDDTGHDILSLWEGGEDAAVGLLKLNGEVVVTGDSGQTIHRARSLGAALGAIQESAR